MSPIPLALLAVVAVAWGQQLPLYTYHGHPYCPQGHSLLNGRCWPSRAYTPPYQNRWPENHYEPPPQNIIETNNQEECPEGYKKARGQCSKLTEREIELDRLPKEPCPPGQRRSRLVCRDYLP